MTEPTMADVLDAVQGFGQTYHDVLKTLDTVLTRLDAHDADSKRDRAGLHEQLAALQRQVDRRFDASFRELDNHRDHIADLQRTRTELLTRLHDVEARLSLLERPS